MKDISIKCITGFELDVDSLSIYNSKLKKHSMLEIMRIEQSIEEDGFLFPITVGKIGDKNYIIDGEATYRALCEMKNRGFNIPKIPVFYIRCKTEQDLKKMILIGTSTNHCVTKSSLRGFCNDENLLKDLGFNEGTLIDFMTKFDFDLEFEFPKKEKKNDMFFGLLSEGVI